MSTCVLCFRTSNISYVSFNSTTSSNHSYAIRFPLPGMCILFFAVQYQWNAVIFAEFEFCSLHAVNSVACVCRSCQTFVCLYVNKSSRGFIPPWGLSWRRECYSKSCDHILSGECLWCREGDIKQLLHFQTLCLWSLFCKF